MTDPRIEIVRAWLGEDNPWENVDRLLSRLDSYPSQPPELVERVAKAIYDSHYERGMKSKGGSKLEWERHAELFHDRSQEYRADARAALSVLPAPMSSADREIVEAAEAWFSGGDFTMANGYDRALVDAVERKRAASHEGKR